MSNVLRFEKEYNRYNITREEGKLIDEYTDLYNYRLIKSNAKDYWNYNFIREDLNRKDGLLLPPLKYDFISYVKEIAEELEDRLSRLPKWEFNTCSISQMELSILKRIVSRKNNLIKHKLISYELLSSIYKVTTDVLEKHYNNFDIIIKPDILSIGVKGILNLSSGCRLVLVDIFYEVLSYDKEHKKDKKLYKLTNVPMKLINDFDLVCAEENIIVNGMKFIYTTNQLKKDSKLEILDYDLERIKSDYNEFYNFK